MRNLTPKITKIKSYLNANNSFEVVFEASFTVERKYVVTKRKTKHDTKKSRI